MVDKKIKVIDAIILIVVTTLLTTFIVAGVQGNEISKKNDEIQGLETLVKYHQQQTFDLLQELHDLKEIHNGE